MRRKEYTMIIHALEITTFEGKVILTQDNPDMERTDDVMLSIDQLPLVIAELQRLYDEKDGI